MTEINCPLLSVIIPLYNKREYILRALQSVADQSFQNFEVIVVDDGSSDGSPNLVAGLQNSKVRLVQQHNMGGAGGQARNTGMVQARGTWFAFLDADDFWFNNHLEELVKIIRHIRRPALISTRPLELPDGKPADPNLRGPSTITERDYFAAAGRHIGLNNCSSSAIHREIFERLGGFANVRSGPDLEYWARIALEYPFALSDRVTSIYYRGNMGNMEQIAAVEKFRSPQIIKSFADVSPSLAMLAQNAESTQGILLRPNIRAYINGRLHAGMRINIRQGNRQRARTLRKMMVGPVCLRIHLLTAVTWLPRIVLESLNAGITAVRRGSRG